MVTDDFVNKSHNRLPDKLGDSEAGDLAGLLDELRFSLGEPNPFHHAPYFVERQAWAAAPLLLRAAQFRMEATMV
jgi:hypothetical protein